MHASTVQITELLILRHICLQRLYKDGHHCHSEVSDRPNLTHSRTLCQIRPIRNFTVCGKLVI